MTGPQAAQPNRAALEKLTLAEERAAEEAERARRATVPALTADQIDDVLEAAARGGSSGQIATELQLDARAVASALKAPKRAFCAECRRRVQVVEDSFDGVKVARWHQKLGGDVEECPGWGEAVLQL